MTSCAPGNIKNKEDKYSCYTKDALIIIAKDFNKKYPENKIKISGKTKKELWNELRKKLSKQCNQEWCWLDQDFIKQAKSKKIEYKHFRPKMPDAWKDDKYTWLTTDDIDAVMKQYENLYPEYVFLGAVPADCHTLSYCQLYNIDFKTMYNKGIKRCGIVFNLDYHYQSGSHWVAAFIDMDKHKDITYYDSYGTPPPDMINDFLNNTYINIQKIPDLKGKFSMKYNKKRHQFGHSECGIYSQNYIIQRLKGNSFKNAVNKKIPDKIMNEMRKYLYRNNS